MSEYPARTFRGPQAAAAAARNAATAPTDDMDLADLARLVAGDQRLDQPDVGFPSWATATTETAPQRGADYDLFQEIDRAFERMAPEQSASSPASGGAQAVQDSLALALGQPSGSAVEAAPHDDMDKALEDALAAELMAEASGAVEPEAPVASAVPSVDMPAMTPGAGAVDPFAMELDRLLASGPTGAPTPATPSTPTAQVPMPMPVAPAEPWADALPVPSQIAMEEAAVLEEPVETPRRVAEVMGAAAVLPVAATLDEVSPLRAPEPLVADATFTPSSSDPSAIDPAAYAYSDPAAQAYEPAPVAMPPERERRGFGVLAAVAAVALLGVTGAVAYGFYDGPNASSPTLLASNDAVKVKPENAGGTVVPNQDRTVYRKVKGGTDTQVKQATLREDAEAPIQVSAVKSGERIAAGAQSGTEGTSQARRVRTVVVKPDGTIVRSARPQTPVRVTTPALSLQQTAADGVQTGAVGTPQTVPAPATTRTVRFNVPSASTTGSQAAPAAAPAPQPVKVAKVEPQPQPAPLPRAAAPEPVAKIQPPKPKPVAKKPAPAPKPEQTAALPSQSSPFAVQIASQRSADAAKRSYATLSRRYASVIGGKGVDIRKAEIAGKGTYYRVRIPAASRTEANRVCANLKRKGGSCFVTR